MKKSNKARLQDAELAIKEAKRLDTTRRSIQKMRQKAYKFNSSRDTINELHSQYDEAEDLCKRGIFDCHEIIRLNEVKSQDVDAKLDIELHQRLKTRKVKINGLINDINNNQSELL